LRSFWSLLLVMPREAAVDKEGGAGGVRGFVRGEKDGHVGDIIGRAQALERNIFKQGLELVWILKQSGVDRRLDSAGGNGVDGDA